MSVFAVRILPAADFVENPADCAKEESEDCMAQENVDPKKANKPSEVKSEPNLSCPAQKSPAVVEHLMRNSQSSALSTLASFSQPAAASESLPSPSQTLSRQNSFSLLGSFSSSQSSVSGTSLDKCPTKPKSALDSLLSSCLPCKSLGESSSSTELSCPPKENNQRCESPVGLSQLPLPVTDSSQCPGAQLEDASKPQKSASDDQSPPSSPEIQRRAKRKRISSSSVPVVQSSPYSDEEDHDVLANGSGDGEEMQCLHSEIPRQRKSAKKTSAATGKPSVKPDSADTQPELDPFDFPSVGIDNTIGEEDPPSSTLAAASGPILMDSNQQG